MRRVCLAVLELVNGGFVVQNGELLLDAPYDQPIRLIACIEDPAVIQKVLAYLDAKAAAGEVSRPPLSLPRLERGRQAFRTSRAVHPSLAPQGLHERRPPELSTL